MLDSKKDLLKQSRVGEPALGFVLGSGLGGYTSRLEESSSIPFAELPDFPQPSAGVASHAGKLWFGRVRSVPVAVMQGRLHLYQGLTPAEVVRPVRLLGALGCRAVCLTNAAGGVRESFQPGDLMRIADHLNLTGQNPLVGLGKDLRFVDLSAAYDPGLGNALEESAVAAGSHLHVGVYAQLLGPTYETPAEIRMLRLLGADAVGMSTVLEAIALRHMDIRVAGLSCITNAGAGISAGPLDHADVTAVAARVEREVGEILDGFVERAAKLI